MRMDFAHLKRPDEALAELRPGAATALWMKEYHSGIPFRTFPVEFLPEGMSAMVSKRAH